jgi:hypothetical protein
MSWKITRIHKHEKKTEEFEAMPSIPKFSPEELTIPAQPAEVAQPLNVTKEEVPTPETPNSQTPEPLPTQQETNKQLIINELNKQTIQKINNIIEVADRSVADIKNQYPNISDNLAKTIIFKSDNTEASEELSQLDPETQEQLIKFHKGLKTTPIFQMTKEWNGFINNEYHKYFPDDRNIGDYSNLRFITTKDILGDDFAQFQPSGAASYTHLPKSMPKENLNVEETDNLRILTYNISQLLDANNITDDAEGASNLFSIINESSDDKNARPLRQIFGYYFKEQNRDEFSKVLEFAGKPTLAQEFKNIDKKIDDIFYGKKQKSKRELDKDYAEFDLYTLSQAERDILAAFRSFGLTPIPSEIKMPSFNQDKKGQNIPFYCDFLLPCDVFEGFDENGVPRIKRQVMFIGEYFGYFGAKYEAKTEVKETLEPIQALMTGNDVIFISKTDFAAGDKPLKLQNQLEAKHIIFDGSSAKQEIQEWLKTQPKTEQTQSIEDKIQKMPKEVAYLRSQMVQLQMYYGEIKNFYNKFMEDPEFVDAISAMYQQYATIKSEIVGINKNIRSIQYKNIAKPLPERQREIDRLMNEWRVKQSQINEIYRSNQKLQNLIREHQEALADPTSDYQERLQSLQTAEQLVVRGDKLEEIPGNNLAEKIIYICNNALAGFTVVGRKTSAAKEFQSFKPLFKAATVLFNKFIRTASSYEFNKLFNKFVK